MRQADELSITVPGRRHPGRQHLGGRLAGREQHDVEAGVVGGVRVLDEDLAAAPRQRPPGGPGRGEEPDLGGREPAPGEDLA